MTGIEYSFPAILARVYRLMTVLLAPVFAMVAGCSSEPKLPDYRYRLTVEVETPEGLRTGSSVIQVASHVASEYALRPGALITQVTGEAVAVDLPDGKVLFALLTKPGSEEGANRYAFDALIPKPWQGWEEYVRDVYALVERHDVGTLPPTAYPMLVTFGDIHDPKSVHQVDPSNLAASFGQGVRLRRIVVQMTDNPVTASIGRRLVWLGVYPEPALNKSHQKDDYSLSATIQQGAFLKTLKNK
jgi:hypothetical protein